MTSFALKRPITVLMLTLGLCLPGVISWQRLPVQLLPQFILPEVYVGTGMPGAAPEKIEAELVVAIEAELATLEGVHDLESRVFADYATTKVSFNHGTDMKFVLLKLQQKMNALENRLPVGTRIEVNRFDTADLSTYLMELSIRGEASLDELREVATRATPAGASRRCGECQHRRRPAPHRGHSNRSRTLRGPGCAAGDGAAEGRSVSPPAGAFGARIGRRPPARCQSAGPRRRLA